MNLQGNLRQKAVRGAGWSALQNWGTQAISFVVFLVLARVLGPESFGLVALAVVFLHFMAVFNGHFVEAIIQRQNLEPEHLDAAFWSDLVVGLLLAVLAASLGSTVGELYREPQIASVIQWLSPGFVLASLSRVQQAILTRDFAFRDLAARSIAARLAGGTVAMAMAFGGFGLWSLVAQQLVNDLTSMLVLWRVSDWRPRFRFSPRHFKELLSFGVNTFGSKLCTFFYQRSDNFLIGYFLGPVALGYYTVAYRVLQVILELLAKTSTTVALPTFSRLQGEPERLRAAFYKVTEFTALVAVPIFLGVTTLAPELVVTLFGREWLPSIPVLQLLALLGVQQAISTFNGTVLIAMGKPNWSLRLNLAGTFLNVLAFVLAVRGGIVAVAAALVLCGFLYAPVGLWAVRRLVGIDLSTYFKQCAAPLGAASAMVATLLALRYMLTDWLPPQVVLTLSIPLGALVYGVAILWLAPQLFRQVQELVHLILPRWSPRKI